MKTLLRFLLVILFIQLSAAIDSHSQVIGKRISIGNAVVTASKMDIGSVYSLFDGRVSTLARSENINPAFVQLVFPEAITVDSVGTFVGQPGAGGDLEQWWLEAADNVQDLESKSGSYMLVVDKGEEKAGVWEGIKLSSPVSKKVWKFNIHRTQGDNYVHMYELGLFQYVDISEEKGPYYTAQEIEANNIVVVNTGGIPCPEIFDGYPQSSYNTKSNDAIILMSFRQAKTFEKLRVFLPQACTWNLEIADKFEDFDSRDNTYETFEPRQSKAGQWDSFDLEQPVRKKYWRLRFLHEKDSIKISEIELYSPDLPEPLSGIQRELELWEGWRWVNAPENLLYYGSGQVPKEMVEWSTSNEEVATVDNMGNIKAVKGGNAVITARYMDKSCTTNVTVRTPVKPLVKETVNQFLATPAENFVYEIPVVIIRYIPTTDGKVKDPAYAPDIFNMNKIPLEDIRGRILESTQRYKFALEQGSRFRAYKNPNARPSIGIRVVDFITVYEPLPPSVRNPIYDDGVLEYAVDFDQMFERINFKDYVENKGVKQIWIWAGSLNPNWPNYNPDIHHPEVFRSMFESYMATPSPVQAQNGGNPLPLPIYNKTYTVLSQAYFYPTYSSNNMECFTHQFESLIYEQNMLQDGNADLFQNKFVGKIGRCGWTHTPPNTEINYGYFHDIQIDTHQVKPTLADIEDWKPDNSGEKKLISHHTWEDIVYDWPDGIKEFDGRYETQWFIYWLQSIPGFENNIPYRVNGRDCRISNWWRFWHDWDRYAVSDFGLWEEATSADDVIDDNQCVIYPNPGEGIFNLHLQVPEGGKYDITVTNVMGQEIFKAKNISDGSLSALDLGSQPSGVYFVKMSGNGDSIIRQIVKK